MCVHAGCTQAVDLHLTCPLHTNTSPQTTSFSSNVPPGTATIVMTAEVSDGGRPGSSTSHLPVEVAVAVAAGVLSIWTPTLAPGAASPQTAAGLECCSTIELAKYDGRVTPLGDPPAVASKTASGPTGNMGSCSKSGPGISKVLLDVPSLFSGARMRPGIRLSNV